MGTRSQPRARGPGGVPRLADDGAVCRRVPVPRPAGRPRGRERTSDEERSALSPRAVAAPPNLYDGKGTAAAGEPGAPLAGGAGRRGAASAGVSRGAARARGTAKRSPNRSPRRKQGSRGDRDTTGGRRAYVLGATGRTTTAASPLRCTRAACLADLRRLP